MILYCAVKDNTAGCYCTDLIPMDNEAVAIRWFYNWLHRSSYAKSVFGKHELELHKIVSFTSENGNICQFSNGKKFLCNGTDDSILWMYNKFLKKSGINTVDSLSHPFEKIEVNKSEGDFIREQEEHMQQPVQEGELKDE